MLSTHWIPILFNKQQQRTSLEIFYEPVDKIALSLEIGSNKFVHVIFFNFLLIGNLKYLVQMSASQILGAKGISS